MEKGLFTLVHHNSNCPNRPPALTWSFSMTLQLILLITVAIPCPLSGSSCQASRITFVPKPIHSLSTGGTVNSEIANSGPMALDSPHMPDVREGVTYEGCPASHGADQVSPTLNQMHKDSTRDPTADAMEMPFSVQILLLFTVIIGFVMFLMASGSSTWVALLLLVLSGISSSVFIEWQRQNLSSGRNELALLSLALLGCIPVVWGLQRISALVRAFVGVMRDWKVGSRARQLCVSVYRRASDALGVWTLLMLSTWTAVFIMPIMIAVAFIFLMFVAAMLLPIALGLGCFALLMLPVLFSEGILLGGFFIFGGILIAVVAFLLLVSLVGFYYLQHV
eukprot:jgi/Botrbrau1/11296/Bobra.0038s0062.2